MTNSQFISGCLRLQKRFLIAQSLSLLHAPNISFPTRPNISDRYVKLGEVLSSAIPSVSSKISPSASFPSAPTFLSSLNLLNYDAPFKEETYTKANGTNVFVTAKLPSQYKRELISDEEIEAIMRGGDDL